MEHGGSGGRSGGCDIVSLHDRTIDAPDDRHGVAVEVGYVGSVGDAFTARPFRGRGARRFPKQIAVPQWASCSDWTSRGRVQAPNPESACLPSRPFPPNAWQFRLRW